MTMILAITNQKGGVGKTTTAVNLAASLAAMQRKVLLLDLDPQGNATMGSGVDKYSLQRSLYDVLTRRCDAQEATVYSEAAGFHLIPANGDLTAAEVELISVIGRELRLSRALAQVQDQYDIILIDCPPSLNMLTVNALVASSGVIIPVQCEYYALEGLSALLETIESIRDAYNPDLGIEGIVRTMYDARNGLTVEVSNQLLEHFGDQVYETVIPRNVRLAEAPSHGLPVLYYDKASRGALNYLALAGEVNRRLANQ
ncbi:MAG: AAA family ATPase [Oceanobacter sp.]